MNNIYLDYAATTPVNEEVLDSYFKLMKENYANSDSLHELGAKASKYLKQARKQISSLLSCKENEIIFTSGSTESNNLAIKGVAFAYSNKGKHIITSQIEHPSVLESCKELENEGFKVTYVPVDENGVVDYASISKAIGPNTILNSYGEIIYICIIIITIK